MNRRDRLARSLPRVAVGALVAVVAQATAAGTTEGKIYWSGGFGSDSGEIRVGNIDGTGPPSSLFTGESTPRGVAIDPAAGKIYWADSSGAIRVGNLDGSGPVSDVFTGETNPVGVAIDPAAQRIYWGDTTDSNTVIGEIRAGNLDGTGAAESLFDGDDVNPAGIAIDPDAGKIYWVNGGDAPDDGAIQVGNLDGTGSVETLFAGETTPYGIAIDPAANTAYWTSRFDDAIRGGRLDGLGPADDVFANEGTPQGVAIDPVAERIYWTRLLTVDPAEEVRVGNLDGTGSVETLFGGEDSLRFTALLRPPSGAGIPEISGGDRVGDELSCTEGSWARDLLGGFLFRAPAGFAYQWRLDGEDVPGAEESTFTPTEAGTYTCRVTASNQAGSAAQTSDPHAVSSKTEVFSPMALGVDPEPLMSLSDGNAVFEPGERVVVAPAWRNDGEFAQPLTGTASGFTGPAGASYTLVMTGADYGDVDSGTIASCLDTEMCYEMEILPAGAPRPAAHWDAAFEEALSDETDTTWTLHVGDSFEDVPRDSLFYSAIETLLHRGVSGEPALARRDLLLVGCGDGLFCPTQPHTRAQAAVFLLKAASPELTPPPCVDGEERFADVPFDSPFCPWIEELARRDVTAGCGDGGDYCPDASVSRAQMAVLLLKAREGAGYTPPECTDELADVPCPSPFADWIEDLLVRGITAGCGTTPPRYCPTAAVARQQMAVFVTRVFELALYGP